MRIIELTAQNVKRLRAVTITPDQTLQVIGGRNAQGKSSVLDAIWLALGGGRASKDMPRPVRNGEGQAQVSLDLGDLKVTRTWNAQGRSTLRVEAADGARYTSPQAILDKLVGSLSFDPLEFTRLPARQQREALLDLVALDVDLDALEAERAVLYDQRTQVGRQGKALGEATVDETLPVEETSAMQVLGELREAQSHNQQLKELEASAEQSEQMTEDARQAVADAEAALKRARKDLQAAENTRTSTAQALCEAGDPIDTKVIEQRLEDLESTNARIRENNAARAAAAERERLRGLYQDLSEQINQIDRTKSQALARAVFPVEGLGFDAEGVTYQGVPFAQASSAEQIRVSLAMAMAVNPELRVLRIMDGSLLDDEAMESIRQQVADEGFQLWIERVGDADEGAVIIEDGQVADR